MSHSRHPVEQYGTKATLLMLFSGPTGSVLAFHGMMGWHKAVCRIRPGCYGYFIVTVPAWIVLKYGYYIKQ